MTDFVRVTAENGSRVTLPRSVTDRHNMKPLKQPAVGRDGKALPDKPKSAVKAESTTTTSSSDDAATTKEGSK